jgi:hypothetical protein
MQALASKIPAYNQIFYIGYRPMSCFCNRWMASAFNGFACTAAMRTAAAAWITAGFPSDAAALDQIAGHAAATARA